ncbi:MAG TPA: hypothetical protein VGM81_14075 [Burkholderiaceae bacterium]
MLVQRFLIPGLLAGLLAAPSARADLITAGTAELVTARSCTVTGVSGCDEISPILYSQYGGSAGAPQSSANLSVAGYGTASGSVALSGVVGAPVLKAGASGEIGARTNTNSVALQRYIYTGATTTTRTFGGELTYAQSITGSYAADVGAGVNAEIEIFTLSDSAISVGSSAEDNFNMLFTDYVTLPGYVSLGLGSYSDAADTAAGSGMASVSVTLDPGESIWVRALLQTPGTNGGWVDASHTFVTGWDDATSLVAAEVSAVPVIGTPWLVGIGLLAMVGVRRRSMNGAAAW